MTLSDRFDFSFRNGGHLTEHWFGLRNGNWFRFMPLQNTPDNPYKGKPPADLHYDPYGSTGQDGHCVPGNERYEPGQHIGDPPNAKTAPDHNPATQPPAEARG